MKQKDIFLQQGIQWQTVEYFLHVKFMLLKVVAEDFEEFTSEHFCK